MMTPLPPSRAQRAGRATQRGSVLLTAMLVATAMGLFAAIPAVIGYNRFSARADVMMGRYQTFSDELTTLLQRAAHARHAKRD